MLMIAQVECWYSALHRYDVLAHSEEQVLLNMLRCAAMLAVPFPDAHGRPMLWFPVRNRRLCDFENLDRSLMTLSAHCSMDEAQM